jgi:hypothetical protein
MNVAIQLLPALCFQGTSGADPISLPPWNLGNGHMTESGHCVLKRLWEGQRPCTRCCMPSYYVYHRGMGSPSAWIHNE